MLLFAILILSKSAQVVFGTFVGLTLNVFLTLLDGVHLINKQQVVDWIVNKLNIVNRSTDYKNKDL